MKILPREEVEKIANRFDIDEHLIFDKVIDFEPDCKIYILSNESDNQFVLICRDYQFDDQKTEERILNTEVGINIVDRLKYKGDYFLKNQTLDDFEYIFSLAQIL